MFRIIPLLILVFQVLAIVEVVKSHKETEKKILWIAVIVLLPVVGMIAWYLVSRGKVNL